MPKKETYSYKGWLNSNSFMKRAFAIAGYGLIPALIIYGTLILIILIFVLIFGLIGIALD